MHNVLFKCILFLELGFNRLSTERKSLIFLSGNFRFPVNFTTNSVADKSLEGAIYILIISIKKYANRKQELHI